MLDGTLTVTTGDHLRISDGIDTWQITTVNGDGLSELKDHFDALTETEDGTTKNFSDSGLRIEVNNDVFSIISSSGKNITLSYGSVNAADVWNQLGLSYHK